MKKLFLVSAVVALLPVFVFVHGGSMMNFGELQTGPEMMEYIIEDSALGEELHEEMEGLMTRMISGEMTQGEAERLTEMMGQYPGPYGMMMVRLSSPQVNQMGWNMMRWNQTIGWGIVWPWVIVLNWFVWLAVGVLLLIWLVKKFSANNRINTTHLFLSS